MQKENLDEKSIVNAKKLRYSTLLFAKINILRVGKY